MMLLKELVNLPDAERSGAIRKAFAPYTFLLEIADEIFNASIVLINLSHKRNEVHDLLDKSLAIEILKNGRYIKECANEMQWLHTHNLKYPDARVAGQRIIAPRVQPEVPVISSWSCWPRKGWSHNSASVNKAKLFGAYFMYQGKPTCLAELIALDNPDWKEVLKELGMLEGQWRSLSEYFETVFPKLEMPGEVSEYSIQVTFPYQGKDLSITPVVSHSLMADIQIARGKHLGRFTSIHHWHSSSVGDLVSATGGNVAALFYPPKTCSVRVSPDIDEKKGSLDLRPIGFNYGVLRSARFISACDVVIQSKKIMTTRGRRDSRSAALQSLRLCLTEWLSPIIFWRGTMTESATENASADPLVQQLVNVESGDLGDILPQLNQTFHLALEKRLVTQRFAYHPELITPIKRQLSWLLNKLIQPADGDKSSEEFSYLRLKDLRVFDAQALACPYLAGLPSLTALWGMAYNFQLRLEEFTGSNIIFEGVAWFIRQYSLTTSVKLPAPSILAGRGTGHVKRPGLIDARHCDMTMDLIIRYRAPDALLQAQDLLLIQAALPARFAGGILHPPPLQDEPSWCVLPANEQALFDDLKNLPNGGRWVLPSSEQPDSLDKLLNILRNKEFILPVMAGYQLLETPTVRLGSHRDHHAYAEPLISVAEFSSPAQLRIMGREHLYRQAFWRLKTKGLTMLVSKV